MPLTQGRKRRAQPESEEPESSLEPQTQRRRTNHDPDDEEEHGARNGATQGGDIEDMAKKLVRLALAYEYQRRPIRRQDISEKVLGPNGRQFKSVFSTAQDLLQAVFGMELVELPVKEKHSLQQKRAAQKSATQKTNTATWILTSIIPMDIKQDILKPAAAPNVEEESTYTAIYTLLVTLISLAGGTLPDPRMERYLKDLQLEYRTPLQDTDKPDKLMKRLEKDGYILKIKETTGGEDDVYWVVGPRGKIEVGERGVTGLTKAVYGFEEGDKEEEELERKIARSLGLNERADGETEQQAPVEKPRKRGKKKSEAAEEEEEEDDEDDDEEDDEDD